MRRTWVCPKMAPLGPLSPLLSACVVIQQPETKIVPKPNIYLDVQLGPAPVTALGVVLTLRYQSCEIRRKARDALEFWCPT